MASSMSADSSSTTQSNKADLEEQIKAKGDEIRLLKEGGADKAAVAPLVQELLALKAQLEPAVAADLEEQIKAKGDEIRLLKEGGADKAAVAPLVQELLALKAQLEPAAAAVAPKKDATKKKKNTSANNNKNDEDDDESESDFITARAVNYSKWYNDVIRVTGLAEASPVRGCMVIKPWGMSLWDRIRNDLDARIKDHGAENAYFPLLIPKSFLSKEAEHVDGFAKECAVVTHHRLSQDPNSATPNLIADPDAELEDPLIIRPTSETMIWYMFRKWIKSHRYVTHYYLFIHG
jgi:prolyl-tRNA synthetase